MMRWFRLLALGGAVALIAPPVRAQPVLVGARAPEIELGTVAGGQIKLSALRGHPVVLSYWSTWCPSCRAELTELADVFRTHSAAGLRVFTINNLSQEEGPSRKKNMKKVKDFVDHFALPFDVALDQRGQVVKLFGIVALPATVFIDSAGIVRGMHMGAISRAELDRGIATIFPPR